MMNQFTGFVVFTLWFSAGFGAVIKIDLSSYSPGNRSVFTQFYDLKDKINYINVENIDVGFFILQVHSYVDNITLFDKTVPYNNSRITGINVGLVYANIDNKTTFVLEKYSNMSIKILIAITVYDETDPVPGGCNLTFENEIAPYQLVSYTDEVIIVDSQAPSVYGISCDSNKVRVDMYHLYLTESDNTENTYFNGILNMISVNDIKKYGTNVQNNIGHVIYRTLFSAYTGTGEVFAIIASYGNRSSAYIPAVSYGCNLNKWNETCITPVNSHWKVICALLFILGFFVNFYGHRFFKTTLCIFGYAFGVAFSLILFLTQDSYSDEVSVNSLVIGILYSLLWLFIWLKFGVPVLSAGLSFILCGSVLASIIFYSGLGKFTIFSSDVNYWVTFVCIVTAVMMLWTSLALIGHIFSCSLLGSYAIVTAYCYYFRGNLQYIYINTFRRITVPQFYRAVIDPPFQVYDIVAVTLWIFFFILGVHYQWKEQRGKPPFPPNRTPANYNSETTPLLS